MSLILSFTIFTLLFIYQYKQYKEVEGRLSTAYSSSQLQSPTLYKLFSTFSEAEHHFRYYSLTFDNNEFKLYQAKLDTIRSFVYSLEESEHSAKNQQLTGLTGSSIDNNLAMEYAALKKQVDNLVLYSTDSLQLLQGKKITTYSKKRILSSDTTLKNIFKDTVNRLVDQDTVVKKRAGLLKRIFQTKDDTLVNKNASEIINQEKLDIIQRRFDHLLNSNERIYQGNMQALRQTIQKLNQTEQELLLANFTLLNQLKVSIEKIQQLELQKIRKQEAYDFAIYKENAQKFGTQVFVVLFIVLLLIFFIMYYQNKVASYENKLIKEKEYASRIAEEKTAVLANISHDIRSPLNSLQGVIAQIKANDTKTLDREIIQSIDYDINVINSTINDILSLSKLEAGDLPINADPLSPYQLMEDVFNLHRFQAQNKQLNYRLENNIAPNIIIKSNAFRMRQVMSNLISNAIKYTDSGTVKISSEVVTLKNKQSLRLKVTDTGVGIAPGKRDEIFKKYFMVDNKPGNKGFGLGLYIVKLFSQQINGEVSFSQNPDGKGTVFSFTMPIAEVQVMPQPEQEVNLSLLPKDLKIVVIDDSPINLFFIQQLFKNHSAVKFFSNGKDALAYIKEEKVDYVITDLIMPEISGWQILKEIKENKNLQQVKVFVSTAEVMLLEQKQTFDWKFDAVIYKPINEKELVNIILANENKS